VDPHFGHVSRHTVTATKNVSRELSSHCVCSRITSNTCWKRPAIARRVARILLIMGGIRGCQLSLPYLTLPPSLEIFFHLLHEMVYYGEFSLLEPNFRSDGGTLTLVPSGYATSHRKGARLLSRIGSGAWVSARFQKKIRASWVS